MLYQLEYRFRTFLSGMTQLISEILEMEEGQGFKSFLIYSAYSLPKEGRSRLGSLA